ncbi:MAG: Ig-like domain-containing protein [Nannocystaceae bacterium]|nr:Ig-like domain-containing protein [bacterium]
MGWRSESWGAARSRAAGVSLVASLVACGGAGDTPGADESGGSTSSSDPAATSAQSTGTTEGAESSGGSTSSVDGSTSSASSSEGGSTTGGPDPGYPAPGDWPSQTGPGGPAIAFDEADLFQNCAFLDGGPLDADHHNLVVMFDGYLMMPWAPEWGGGGVTFFDVSDPCAPSTVGSTFSGDMRETHAVGFTEIGGRWYISTAHVDEGLLNTGGGVMFWDVTNPAQPLAVSTLTLPGHLYPDAYARVVQSGFWQGDHLYVGGSDNGLYIVDASDPINPTLVAQEAFEPTLRVGQVQVVGNLLIATAAEGPRTVLLDVSIPTDPQPIAGGDFVLEDSEAVAREAYFANVTGGYVWYAVKSGGGGIMAYDVRDPSNPTYAGHFTSGGNGGYVFVKDDIAVMGESSFAGLYDVSDMSDMQLLEQLDLEGDLDTATPIGNVIVLSVDDEANPGEASSIAPYLAQPDADAPYVNWSVPADGAEGLAPTSRVGVTFNEMVAPKSAWEGSVRLYETADPSVRIAGTISTQESVVNFDPDGVLTPGTQYTFEIPAGGVVDYNGNAVEETFSISFTVAG